MDYPAIKAELLDLARRSDKMADSAEARAALLARAARLAQPRRPAPLKRSGRS